MKGLKLVMLLSVVALPTICGSQSAQAQNDTNRVISKFEPGTTSQEQQIEQYLSAPGRIDHLISQVNEELRLNADVYVLFAPSTPGEPEAMYMRDRNVIFIGYGIVARTQSMFDDEDDSWYRGIEHLVLHEIAHALIHVNNIDIDSAESETSADELAFFILSAIYDAPFELDPVVTFFDGLTESNDNNTTFATFSPHLPTEARADNYLCWIIGKEPSLADTEQEDADTQACVQRHNELEDLWDDHLEPHWRNNE